MGLVTNTVVGVNHSELLAVTEQSLFGSMPEAMAEVIHPTDEYVGGLFTGGCGWLSHDTIGGECRITASTPLCHVMLGCKGVGLGNTVKEVMTARVLQVWVIVSLFSCLYVCPQHLLGLGEDVVKYSDNSLSR